MIKKLDNDIVLFTINKNFTGFSKEFFEYLKLKKKDVIISFINFNYKKIIENLIELNNFQISINRIMIIIPAMRKQLVFQNDLNFIKSIEEGIDYIMFEKIQREL
tara:strand:+ start:146 stop:460 length:315 start_codon:yes stop_codon:yes gene_type:complete